MASLLSNYAANAMLTLFFSKPTWLGLHRSDPGVNGDLSTEFSGGGYVRQPAIWTISGSKTVVQNQRIIFTDLPVDTLTYIAVWEAGAAGNMIIRAALPAPIGIVASGQWIAQVGDIAWSL